MSGFVPEWKGADVGPGHENVIDEGVEVLRVVEDLAVIAKRPENFKFVKNSERNFKKVSLTF